MSGAGRRRQAAGEASELLKKPFKLIVAPYTHEVGSGVPVDSRYMVRGSCWLSKLGQYFSVFRFAYLSLASRVKVNESL